MPQVFFLFFVGFFQNFLIFWEKVREVTEAKKENNSGTRQIFLVFPFLCLEIPVNRPHRHRSLNLNLERKELKYIITDKRKRYS